MNDRELKRIIDDVESDRVEIKSRQIVEIAVPNSPRRTTTKAECSKRSWPIFRSNDGRLE